MKGRHKYRGVNIRVAQLLRNKRRANLPYRWDFTSLERNFERASITGKALVIFMLDQAPHKITESEWQEIAALEVVQQAWGLDSDIDPSEFASTVYGARFNYVSGGPGYVGSIYVLQGDSLTEVSPMVLRRERDGRLIVC